VNWTDSGQHAVTAQSVREAKMLA